MRLTRKWSVRQTPPRLSRGLQNGSDGYDDIRASAIGDNESVVFVGYTKGNWSGDLEGNEDFAAVSLNVSNGEELWRWQVGTVGYMPSCALVPFTSWRDAS